MKSFTGSLTNALLLLMLSMVLQGSMTLPTNKVMDPYNDIELPNAMQEVEDTNEMDDDDATLNHHLERFPPFGIRKSNASDHLSYLPVHNDVALPPPRS